MFDTTIGWRFVNPLMAQQFGTDSMPETAENVAELLKISQEIKIVLRYAVSNVRQKRNPQAFWLRRLFGCVEKQERRCNRNTT